MRYTISLILFILMLSTHAHACIVRNIINNSTRCEILIRSVVIPGLEKSRRPNVITPRKGIEPHVVSTKNKLGVGEYMRLLVTEKSPLGSTCKKYRIFVDEKNKILIVQKKDGCSIGLLEYQTLGYKPMPIDPNNCYLDIYLNDDVNSLFINVVPDAKAEVEPIRDVMAEQGYVATQVRASQAPQAD